MCNVEQIADCGDLSSLARALFIPEREDASWLSQCPVSLSSCGNLLAVGYKNRICFLTTQWISSSDSNSYLISWSGTLPSDITAVLALPLCPSQHSSQNGPDWFCIIVGFQNGNVGFYTNTGHLLLLEKLDEKSVMKISCHTGTYGTLPDDIHILFQGCVCIISGASLFQSLRNAKAQLARVHAGIQGDYAMDSRSINIRKWTFVDQEGINDGAVVGLELKNTYDHFLAASTYGGYDTWYRSVPPVHTLILTAGVIPYIGFHYALEGGTTPPLQDVARAVANKIKSALPGWLGGGGSIDNTSTNTEPLIRSEVLSLSNGIYDTQRHGIKVAVSPDRRLAAFVDNLGRVAVLDVTKGYLIRLFKGCRDAQCAFVQIFDADNNKKPQLSVIKEIKRAVFLIIYNPKKGLIDIRLMCRGNRVAVFTATKNGILMYNTCGLIGAEKNYAHKSLNLPEFQCVLIDPDGKLKKINIPFYYSLEGEHLERSKDLHVLRAIRDLVKRTSNISEDLNEEIIKNASKLNTLEIKKHCIDLLIRNSEPSTETVLSCLEIFWDNLTHDNFNANEQKISQYFANLALVTMFYRYINNMKTDDMDGFITKVRENCHLKDDVEINNQNEVNEITEFHLLEDDNCILERLLILAEEKDFKEQQQHIRVTFADNNISSYKEFVSCFQLDESSTYIHIKPNASSEKMKSVASIIFKCLFKLKNLKLITNVVKKSNIDPKDIVKLVILHLMDMSLHEFNIDLIEKLIAVLFYLSDATEQASVISYNEISAWWQDIRDMLVDMHCPLRSMIVAMACKAAANTFECTPAENEDAWESVTTESAKWGILIGKLEDISMLSIILMSRTTFQGKPMPKLQVEDVNINLKFIYTRGKGSITELIAKWLSAMGVPPQAIIANELMEIYPENLDDCSSDSDGSPEYLFVQNNSSLVTENPKIFKWLSLLRRQFPLSTSANYIIANMCWEYAMAWQKCMTRTEELVAVVDFLNTISNLHLRLGLFTIIWSTYIKHIFETSCRLVNKIGKLPKDYLSLQELGFNSEILIKFLEATTKYLHSFFVSSTTAFDQEKQTIQFEKIWDESLPSLVEVAQDTGKVSSDILNLNYQISCTVYYQCYFNFKYSKPLDTLYDVDYQYALEALAGSGVHKEIESKVSDKIINPRKKYLTRIIRTAIETIATLETSEEDTLYNNDECLQWIDNICNLADLWGIDQNFVRQQHVIGLYHLGFDRLAENELSLIIEPELLLPPVLAITIQRLKRNLENSKNQPEWIVSVAPHLYKRLQTTVLDTSIPANPSLPTTVMVLQKILSQIDRRSSETTSNLQCVKLAELIIENCENLIRRNI